MKDERQIVERLSTVLDQYRHAIVFAYLFGSFAEGARTVLSDIDIAIYAASPEEMGFQEKLAFQADCCRALACDKIDVIVLNQSRNLVLAEEIVRRGHLILDNEPDIRIGYEAGLLHEAMDFRHHRKVLMGL